MWGKIKVWFQLSALPWLEKNWEIIVNYLVILIAYNNVYDKPNLVGTEVLLGLWIFVSIAYGGWKWFTRK
jgi:hypothetical protein